MRVQTMIAASMLAVFFLTPSFSHAADFRMSDWGETSEEVSQKEEKTSSSRVLKRDSVPDSDLDMEVIYQGVKRWGSHVTVSYLYSKREGLQSGYYLVNESFTDRARHIELYREVMRDLQGRYGKPRMSKMFWADDVSESVYRSDDDSMLGWAIARGDMKIVSKWETGDGGLIKSKIFSKPKPGKELGDVRISVKYMSPQQAK